MSEKERDVPSDGMNGDRERSELLKALDEIVEEADRCTAALLSELRGRNRNCR